MSIPEATKKHLAAVRKKLSTQEIMTALEAGGLPAMRKLVPNFRVARDPLGTELFYIPRTPFSIRPRT